MNREHRTVVDRPQRPTGTTRLATIESRLDANERRLMQLENALNYVARRSGDVSVISACNRCDRSLLVVDDGMIVCPCCGYARHL